MLFCQKIPLPVGIILGDDYHIDILGLEFKEVSSYLFLRKKRIQNYCFQLYEPNPFVKKPFLKTDQGVLLLSRKLFEKTINDYFYDQVKSEGNSRLAEEIGKRLENYIEDVLTSIPLNFLNERNLKNLFPNNKVTDFLIPQENYNILIEVKSQEINPTVQVFPDNIQLIHELEDSIIKATIQAYSLVQTIKKSENINSINKNKPFFLLIVTYKDFYLGNGKMMWNEFLEEATRNVLKKNKISSKLIPSNQISVLSINDFDILVSCLMEGENKLELM